MLRLRRFQLEVASCCSEVRTVKVEDPCAYSVYAYVFDDGHTYIGLTKDPRRRDYCHRYSSENPAKDSSVMRYWKKSGQKCFPDMLVLYDGLSATEAQRTEGILVEAVEPGVSLNKAKTGVGSGGLGSRPAKTEEERELAKSIRAEKHRQFNREYRLRHLDAIRKCMKTYKRTHREKIRSFGKRYYSRHRETINEKARARYNQLNSPTRDYKKAYRQEHREEIHTRHKEYCKQNAEKLRLHRKNYYRLHREEILERGKAYSRRRSDERRKYLAEYRRRNREKLRELDRLYRLTHRDQISKRNKAYYQKNLEKLREYSKRYYQRNRTKICKRKKDHRRKE